MMGQETKVPSMAAEIVATSPGGESKTGVAGYYEKVKDYIDDLKAEMRRVSWPSRTQVQATTGVVIAAIFLFAAYFAVVDLLLGRAINQIFQTLARR
jgi:preprotein translocase subunit SecE